MPAQNHEINRLDALRAEAELKLTGAATPQIPAPDNEQLLHELRVHQVELEMQNEELRLTQVTLEESRDRYLRLYDFAPIGYLTLSSQGVIVEANLACTRLLGIDRKRLISRRFRHYVVNDESDPWYHFFLHTMEQSAKQTCETSLRHADGTVLNVNLDCLPISGAGFPPMLNIAITNISERKQSEQKEKQFTDQIKRYAAEISDIYQNAPCGYHSLGKDGEFLHVNQTELNWLGYARDELIGKKTLADLLAPAAALNFRQTFIEFKKSGELIDLELELVRKDKTILPVMMSSSAMRDDAGHYLASRSTVYDMTERKKTEQERNEFSKRMNVVSRHLVAAQEEIRRRLSSELHSRTSSNLAAISVNLDIIASEIPRKLAGRLIEHLEDTRALLTDTTASIREISADMRPPSLDYAGLVAALESYVQQFTRRTGIVVKFDCVNRKSRYSRELENLLFRIVQEALTNCAKHAHAGKASVTLNNPGNSLVLSIADDGVGFDPAALGSDSAIGLGLITMREMAEIAGGKLTIVTATGKGTLISLEIFPDQPQR
jgi:PAS domain S-box-containing protein